MPESQPQSETLCNKNKGEILLCMKYNGIIQIHLENTDNT